MSRFKENDVPIDEALEILEIDHSSNNSNYKSKKYKSSNDKSLHDQPSKDKSLYDQLRNVRTKLAQEKKMSPFIIAHNASLEEMIIKRPVNLNEMLKIKGFGKKKTEKYGQRFLDILNNYKESKYYNYKKKTSKTNSEKTSIETETKLPSDFERNKEFTKIYEDMENTSYNLFITGKAGTGKSTLLQYFKENTKKDYVVLAPTGVSAIKIGGETIHSFFQIPPGKIVQKKDIRKCWHNKKVFKKVRTILIDEASMIRADIMDAIDYSLRLNKYRMHVPFGGTQIILIADLYQLPPIVTEEEKEVFNELYPSGPFFFNSNVITNETGFRKYELSTIYRQTENDLINFLNKIRSDNITVEDLEFINQRVEEVSPGNDIITLTPHNAEADIINTELLNKISSKSYIYKGEVDRKFGDYFPTSFDLELKEGAQIMMIKNESGKWVNGTIGKIESLSENEIKVNLNEKIHVVEKVIWEKKKFKSVKGDVKDTVIGSFKQYPIKIAWAITIHKSQGQTFDKFIVDMSTGAFAHGQTYVALSRATNFKGIYLKSSIKLSDIKFDKRILNFVDE